MPSVMVLFCGVVLTSDSPECGTRTVEWKPHRDPKVIGGQFPPLGAVPWQVGLLSSDDRHHCGGALISSRLVLSAAHCISDDLKAMVGGHGAAG